jgi:hypothetical protein
MELPSPIDYFLLLQTNCSRYRAFGANCAKPFERKKVDAKKTVWDGGNPSRLTRVLCGIQQFTH